MERYKTLAWLPKVWVVLYYDHEYCTLWRESRRFCSCESNYRKMSLQLLYGCCHGNTKRGICVSVASENISLSVHANDYQTALQDLTVRQNSQRSVISCHQWEKTNHICHDQPHSQTRPSLILRSGLVSFPDLDHSLAVLTQKKALSHAVTCLDTCSEQIPQWWNHRCLATDHRVKNNFPECITPPISLIPSPPPPWGSELG